jgi:hypothetical protein
MTILRYLLADLLLAIAALCDRIDTALADSCNGPEDE